MADRDYGSVARDDLVDFACADGVPRRVLDVGCGAGATGALFKLRGAELVVGVDASPRLADIARTKLDQVVEGNIESMAIPYGPHSFDCILYADILEHLVDPGQCLVRHQPLLAPDGVVVASLPNVGHYSVLVDLAVRGEWRYRECGIMDATHLRFFTKKSMQRLFEDCGMIVTRIGERLEVGPKVKILHRVLGRRLDRFAAYQYFLSARVRHLPREKGNAG